MSRGRLWGNWRPLGRRLFCRGGLKPRQCVRSVATRSQAAQNAYTGTRNLIYGSGTLALLGFGYVYFSDSRNAVYRYLAMPLAHLVLDPETAHYYSVKFLATGLGPRDKISDDESLSIQLWDRKFSNPVGLAAGMDKQAEAIDGFFDLGFGYVEVGTVTPEPQPGNPRPRYFRLSEDSAVVNRYGFNSDGHDAIILRLRDRLRHFLFHVAHAPAHKVQDTDADLVSEMDSPKSLRPGRALGVNIGKNKDGDPLKDYTVGVRKLGRYADMLVVNVSSPNTPGLRQLQSAETLTTLLQAVIKERDALPGSKPSLLVKIAPDLNSSEIQGIAKAVRDSRVDGVIVSNTTIQRPSTLKPNDNIHEAGGLSGPPLKTITLDTLRQLRKYLPESVPIVGCGGISTGKDAVEYARAGASLVQVYTALGYDGPGYPRRLKDEILAELKGQKWSDIIGQPE